MSAVELNFAENRFDAAVAATSIEQTSDPMRALREIYRVLKPGARLLVLYESLDVSMAKPFEDSVTLREHMDGTHGWYYWMKHRDPPWERNYLVRFKPTAETDAAFAQARELIDKDGVNPAQVPGVGLDFLEANKAAVAGASYYELEHFTTKTMVETLEDVGFENVRAFYSAARVARQLFPNLNAGEMGEHQLMELAQGLAQAATALPAPFDQGQPVIARKPDAPH
jgi:SAM-dependent methyltransferase